MRINGSPGSIVTTSGESSTCSSPSASAFITDSFSQMRSRKNSNSLVQAQQQQQQHSSSTMHFASNFQAAATGTKVKGLRKAKSEADSLTLEQHLAQIELAALLAEETTVAAAATTQEVVLAPIISSSASPSSFHHSVASPFARVTPSSSSNSNSVSATPSRKHSMEGGGKHTPATAAVVPLTAEFVWPEMTKRKMSGATTLTSSCQPGSCTCSSSISSLLSALLVRAQTILLAEAASVKMQQQQQIHQRNSSASISATSASLCGSLSPPVRSHAIAASKRITASDTASETDQQDHRVYFFTSPFKQSSSSIVAAQPIWYFGLLLVVLLALFVLLPILLFQPLDLIDSNTISTSVSSTISVDSFQTKAPTEYGIERSWIEGATSPMRVWSTIANTKG